MAIDALFQDKNIICKNYGITILNDINPNAHLIIDVEHAYHSTLLDKIGFPNTCKNVTLSEIPTLLKIKNENYQLSGTISYSDHAQEIGHYIAYCYKIAQNSFWEKYNNLKNKSLILQPTMASRTLIRPSIIVYTKLVQS